MTDPIISLFRSRLDALYGDRIARVVLFGSRARGDAREDSDYDVAVFLRGMTDRWAEIDKIEPIEADLLLQRGVVVQALPYHERQYGEPTPLMHEIRREGVDI